MVKNYHTFFIIFLFLGMSSKVWPINQKPRVSIITSVYNGDEFIEGFLEDVVQQTIFNQCELILINANSPGNEERVIERYLQQYANINYIKLDYDPGIYGVWNRGIIHATADLITNANLDDRRNPRCLEIQAELLETDPNIDLVYGDYYITEIPNETFESNHYRWIAKPLEFSRKNMYLCLPGPQPMWRKSMHEKYGYFDETFSSAGDFEMWLRAVSKGAQFKYIPFVTGLYYLNPHGISTTTDLFKKTRRDRENELIITRYRQVWS